MAVRLQAVTEHSPCRQIESRQALYLQINCWLASWAVFLSHSFSFGNLSPSSMDLLDSYASLHLAWSLHDLYLSRALAKRIAASVSYLSVFTSQMNVWILLFLAHLAPSNHLNRLHTPSPLWRPRLEESQECSRCTAILYCTALVAVANEAFSGVVTPVNLTKLRLRRRHRSHRIQPLHIRRLRSHCCRSIGSQSATLWETPI